MESPRSAYELIKIELVYYLRKYCGVAGLTPSANEMQYEACRIIYASEATSGVGLIPGASWLRDLLMSSDEIKRRAQLSPIRGSPESCLPQLKVKGKDNIFDDCLLEKELVEFVKARTLLGLTVVDSELQVEVCNILGRMEQLSTLPSEEVAKFMMRLVNQDQTWLCSFRRRADLPKLTNSTWSNLDESTRHKRAMGLEPSDIELRRQDRVVHMFQDSCGQMAADDLALWDASKQRQSQQQNIRMSPPESKTPQNTLGSSISAASAAGTNLSPLHPDQAISSGLKTPAVFETGPNSTLNIEVPRSYATGAPTRTHGFLNGAYNHRELVEELVRYVASCMSSNNPAQRTPTDEEIRHQARWIMYDK